MWQVCLPFTFWTRSTKSFAKKSLSYIFIFPSFINCRKRWGSLWSLLVTNGRIYVIYSRLYVLSMRAKILQFFGGAVVSECSHLQPARKIFARILVSFDVFGEKSMTSQVPLNLLYHSYACVFDIKIPYRQQYFHRKSLTNFSIVQSYSRQNAALSQCCSSNILLLLFCWNYDDILFSRLRNDKFCILLFIRRPHMNKLLRIRPEAFSNGFDKKHRKYVLF